MRKYTRTCFGLVCMGWIALLPLRLSGQTLSALDWTFPLTRVHTGMLLANGTQGLMVWGEGDELRITVGRAGFWDHRGGNDFSTQITYDKLRTLLEARDDEAVKAAFAVPEKPGKTPDLGRPQQLGGGRVVIRLPQGWSLTQGKLILGEGKILVSATNGKVEATLVIRQSPTAELAMISLPPSLESSTLGFVPAYEFVQETYASVGIQAPVIARNSETGIYSCVQPLPEDLPLAIGYRKVGNQVFVASALEEAAGEAVFQALSQPPSNTLVEEADAWWEGYWASVPRAVLPDPALQEIYDYGLYKQACVTPPQGVACTLQGPFMEDYQLPPWSNDYHFNINIEMIYYPALMSGRFDHFDPLWEMIHGWNAELKRNGEAFFQQEGALMLPHAVDDRCKVVGTFWTGTIDHACTAWMAQLAWLHYAYSGDREVLSETAYPLLIGAFEGFWAMLEKKEDRFSLPVSVSPEYRGSRMDAWGENASFQLAALHAVCQILPEAATALGKPLDPRWGEVAEGLPSYTTVEGVFLQEWNASNERIALWEGMDLIESHRHHSHLGSIWPFVTIDPLSEQHGKIVQNSLAAWRYRGAGGWSGWCVPWAAILMSRTNQAEASINWLRYWKDNFVNEGRGTLHNANNHGHSYLGAPVWNKYPEMPPREVMQLDAGFGALTAVYELLAQKRKDGIHIFPGLSIYWQEAAFEDLWMEGGLKLSARVEGGKVVEVRVAATREGDWVLHPNLGESFTVNGTPHEGAEVLLSGEAGATWTLAR